ncbi:MAG: flagellar FlbD family protein [Thermodesulfobacteriota bacterium]|nr:flagellar FlbD family protein [Thermodesulfobacteriota bacterium]
MIKLTRLNNAPVLINVDRILSLHSVPDTVITFTNEIKMMVKEPPDEISRKIAEHRRMTEPELLHDLPFLLH